MAVQTIAVPPDPKRDARALELVDSVGSWPLFVLKQPYGAFPAGTVFRRAPSSKGDGTYYLVNAVACRCPDYQGRGALCKHVRAIVLWEARQQAASAPVQSVPTHGARSLTDQDAQAALDAIMAQHRAERQQSASAPCKLTADDLWPACAAGCGELVDRQGEKCYACLSNETRRETVAAKRRAVFGSIAPFTLNPLAE